MIYDEKLSASVHYLVEGVQFAYRKKDLPHKDARRLVAKALKSAVVLNEVIEQVDCYLENGGAA